MSALKMVSVALVLGLIGLLPAQAQTMTVTYIHTDALGSPVLETNQAGQVVREVDYRAYGEEVLDGPQEGPGYTGHYRDTGTGLVYMQQRYYDPLASRFLSVDPINPIGEDGANFNRFWYAANNPARYVDPDGRIYRVSGWMCAGGSGGICDGPLKIGYETGAGPNVAVASDGHRSPGEAAIQFGNDTRSHSGETRREPQAGIVRTGPDQYGYTVPLWGDVGSAMVDVGEYFDALLDAYGTDLVGFAHGHWELGVPYFSEKDVLGMGNNTIYLSNQQGETRVLNQHILERELRRSRHGSREALKFLRGGGKVKGQCISGC